MWRGKLDCFDLKKNEWRYVTEEPLRSSNGCAINFESSTCCAFGGGLIFVGGEEHNLPVHVYRVDQETGAKVELARLPLSRDRPAVGVCDGRLVVLGGQWGTHANQAQEAERKENERRLDGDWVDSWGCTCRFQVLGAKRLELGLKWPDIVAVVLGIHKDCAKQRPCEHVHEQVAEDVRE